jgi:hypothetical protein
MPGRHLPSDYSVLGLAIVGRRSISPSSEKSIRINRAQAAIKLAVVLL